MQTRLFSTLLPLLWMLCHPAWAGRPLATDDASTTEHGTCQVESWLERARDARAFIAAPACGVAEGVEIGADYTLPRPRDELRAGAGVAMKWVPSSWRVSTAAGDLNFGLKVAAAFDRPAGSGWRTAETGALALATLAPSDAFTLHANLGAARDKATGRGAALFNLALAWAPRDDALLFVETQANSRREVFGGTVNSVGGRWWWVKDAFGLDLSAGREAGSGRGTVWTLGFGWYGLSL